MQACVKLPSGPLIPYLYFCRLIAQAVCPIKKTLEGIECVSAKVYFSPDSATPYIGEGVPFLLDDADRQVLAEILPILPPLRCPMSKEELASFMDAYVNLPNRPIWTPVLETEETIRSRKFKHDTYISKQVDALREEHRAGLLVAVSSNHLRLSAVELGAHLTRKDAIAYLERHGLAYEDEKTTRFPEQDLPSNEATHQSQNVDQRHGLVHDAEETATCLKQEDSPMPAAEAQSLSGDEKKAAIVKYHAEMNAQMDESPTAKTAEKFKVTATYVRRVIRKAKAKKAESSQSLVQTVLASWSRH